MRTTTNPFAPSSLGAGTHSANTKEAEDFVIVEESAVAKGVRRITAVTRNVAREARENGRGLTNLVTEIENHAESSTDVILLEASSNKLRKDIDSTSLMSYSTKTELRGRIEKLQKRANELRKANAGQVMNDCLKLLTSKLEAGTEAICVERMDGGVDAKSAQKIVEKLRLTVPGG